MGLCELTSYSVELHLPSTGLNKLGTYRTMLETASRAVPCTPSIDSAGGAFSAGKPASVGAKTMQGWESREPETKIDNLTLNELSLCRLHISSPLRVHRPIPHPHQLPPKKNPQPIPINHHHTATSRSNNAFSASAAMLQSCMWKHFMPRRIPT